MSGMTTKQLLGVTACIEAVFTDAKSRPSVRTFRQWQKNRYFPFHKIGHRTFFDPDEVRAAISRRFKINAEEA